jgi:hypothetical protein
VPAPWLAEEGGGAAARPLTGARARPMLSSLPSSGLGDGALNMCVRHGQEPTTVNFAARCPRRPRWWGQV